MYEILSDERRCNVLEKAKDKTAAEEFIKEKGAHDEQHKEDKNITSKEVKNLGSKEINNINS